MFFSRNKSLQCTTSMAVYSGVARAGDPEIRRSSAGRLTDAAALPANRDGGLRSGSYILHHSCNFEPEINGSEITEQPKLAGDAVRGPHNSAPKKQNPTRDNSKYTMKILRLQPKNIGKKEFFFWLNEPDKLLKTQSIRKFLRKTNPSEPEKPLKTNDIRIC